ncbi:hypothetical protein [Demequina zhanjiangensis]|uniref:SpaA-like prealbumin fold domain-containing protein n=1 Tax=Demequina zhanjiangensis TaxID=3051659 RepID=A0ABT8G1H2_9MICO|nr:hypothetical protein [Demequina sp. SYSU T00b26]MDN4472973.1 hypothetical protein [Demequina sp. SYSU T00b26]
MNTTIPAKGRLALLAVTSLVVATLVALPAHAALPGSLPWNATDGLPNMTGTMLVVSDSSGNSKELGPINGNAYKVEAIHRTAVPVLGKTNPNPGTDMTEVRIDTATVGTDVWGYFAFTIESFSTGQSAWEFMEKAAPPECDYDSMTEADLIAACNPWLYRQAGDFFIVADYQGNSVTLGYRVWMDNVTGAASGGDADYLGDFTLIPDTVGGGRANAETGYVEMAVNITQAVFGGALRCTSIGNIIPSTLTGNSDSADYKDVVLADLTEQTTIANCGSVTVSKVLEPSSATGYDDSFDWTLARTGGDAIRYQADGGALSATDTLYGGDSSPTETKLIAAANYTLGEVIDPGDDGITAFELKSIVCTTEDGTDHTVTAGGTFPVKVGETTSCVITNKERKGTLTVYKTVTNDNGGTKTYADFTFSLTGPNGFVKLTNQGFSEDTDTEADGVWSLAVMPGTYTATEDDVAGYTEDDSDCASVDVPAGGSASCTIANDDDPSTIVVTKTVDNGAGGVLEADDFSVTLTGPTTGLPSSKSFVNDEGKTLEGRTSFGGLSAGSGYSITEDAYGGDVTYTVTYGGDCNADGTLKADLGLGQTRTCTVLNVAQKASPDFTTVQDWVLHDTATFTGIRAGAPSAGDVEVTFGLYTDAQCSVPVTGGEGFSHEESVALSGGIASTVDGIAVDEPGTYYWKVQYPGDEFNNPQSYCGDEVTEILALDEDHDTWPAAGTE